MTLFLKYSNICDHYLPLSQTDGQTDRQMDDTQSQDRALLYSASHGKKVWLALPLLNLFLHIDQCARLRLQVDRSLGVKPPAKFSTPTHFTYSAPQGRNNNDDDDNDNDDDNILGTT